MNKTFRYYQQDAVEAVFRALERGRKKQLIVLPGGTGKTVICTEILHKFEGRKGWISHEEILAEQSAITVLIELDLMPEAQLRKIINDFGGLVALLRHKKHELNPLEHIIHSNIGMVKADIFDIDKPIVVCSAQSLWRRLDKMPPDWFSVLIADEGDLFGSKTFKEPLDYFQTQLTLGATATDYRMDGMLMEDIFEEKTFEYPIEQAIKDGYLTEINAIVVKTSIDLDSVHTSMGDFNQKELTEKINTPARNYLIVDKYSQYCSGQQFICFAADVQHVIDLHDCFKEKGVKTAYVVSDKDKMIVGTDRKTIVSQYRKGEIMGLVNFNIFSAGFDHPDCGTVILACPTKSKRKFLQQLFRVTRLKTDTFVEKFGQIGTVLDIIDGTSKHVLINTKELDKGKEIEDRVFVSEKNKQLLIEAREARKRDREFTSSVRKEDKKVKLFELPRTKIISSFRMQEPASDAQLLWVKNLGYDIENINYTKLMCSEIISNSAASKGQIEWLKFNKYNIADRVVTIGEFQAAKKQVESRELKRNLSKK
jgi:superfamily II DNA or RNA helicase